MPYGQKIAKSTANRIAGVSQGGACGSEWARPRRIQRRVGVPIPPTVGVPILRAVGVPISLLSLYFAAPILRAVGVPISLLDQRWVSLSSGAYLSGAPRPAVGVPISLSGGCPYLSGARPSNSGLRNHSTGNRPVISSIAACDLGYWPLSSVSWIQPASASRISSSTAL